MMSMFALFYQHNLFTKFIHKHRYKKYQLINLKQKYDHKSLLFKIIIVDFEKLVKKSIN